MLFDRSPHTTEPEPHSALDDGCYVVLVVDPCTALTHAHGPFDGLSATVAADGLRTRLDAAGRDDVTVTVSRVHRPEALGQYLRAHPRAVGGGR